MTYDKNVQLQCMMFMIPGFRVNKIMRVSKLLRTRWGLLHEAFCMDGCCMKAVATMAYFGHVAFHIVVRVCFVPRGSCEMNP